MIEKYGRYQCFLLFLALPVFAHEKNISLHDKSLHCRKGFFCPTGSPSPVPCPKGTFGPAVAAVSAESCLECPSNHHCPRPGLSAPLTCGPMAQQPQAGQETCVCQGEGQHFQISDGRCVCGIGYKPTSDGEMCAQQLYSICRDGTSRTQHGDCYNKHQWSLHCRDEVCQTAEDYRGYDSALGLCVCREPPGRAACGGLCRTKPAVHLMLQCNSDRGMDLMWRHQVLSMPESLLVMIFKKWDSPGTLECSNHHKSTHPVYIVQTTETGFFGFISGLPEEIQQLLPGAAPNSADEGYDLLHQATDVENGSGSEEDIYFRQSTADVEKTGRTGILNPTTCLHLGDILLFTVQTQNFPVYNVDSLYNTNTDFDWGPFRLLREELTLSWTTPVFFSVIFNQHGVYVFTLSSNQHKHLYVRVMPAGAQCYEPGPFFPTTPRHMTRMGISRRRDLLLRPDWLVTGGLVFGAVVVLCLCVALLILFREYGWPQKQPIKVSYRSLQLSYQMDDYSSKGSRVVSVRKTHRKQQTGVTQDPTHPDISAEFWDYERQVDLEAFSSNTFYSLLFKQSLSITTRLGQLTTEVKELYQGVLGKLQLLQPGVIAEGRVGDGYEQMKREVEKEVLRRKSSGSQLQCLLNSQLQVLKQELRAKRRVYGMFASQLRECTRLLPKISKSSQPSCELQQQIFTQKLTSVVNEIVELLSAECHRQGAWGLLGEGTGARLLCPDTGNILCRDDIFGPDGSLGVSAAVHYDSVTGLIRPNVHSHMLLSSGHTMAVPPDFFLHPQTCRVLPIIGNVAYDPTSSTLVFTTDNCMGGDRKWENPLLPFLPYPTLCHSEQPLTCARLKGLKPGQKLQLGIPMADPDTGVPVPILAVTIHPVTGLVYPLGKLHTCPLSRLPQPIQIGHPMLDPRTGKMTLITGVSLDPVTGDVLPVGGVLLGESFTEPLSGRMVRAGGASIKAGQLLPHAGGYQTLLDSKVLLEMFKALEHLRHITEGWSSDTTLPQIHQHKSHKDADSGQDNLLSITKELEQAWGRSLHCQMQLQTRMEALLEWAEGLQQDGGCLGEMSLPDCEMHLPALLGMEYPDPMGSGLSVPVLGSQRDPVSTNNIPLAGTMEAPDGKGLVAIRYGAQTVDPVTGLLAPVVGARLDVSRKHILPVTASYWLMIAEQTDTVQVEVLQREVCVRNAYWQHQRQREDDVLSDLDLAVFQSLFGVTDAVSSQIPWSGGQMKDAASELQVTAQAEAQRRAAQHSYLTLVLPSHVLTILISADEDEWEQQCAWQSALVSGLDRLDICMDLLQQDNDRWESEAEEWSTNVHAEKEVRLREIWEQWGSTRTQLDSALTSLHFIRHLSQLQATTAQAVQCGHFWFKDYSLFQFNKHEPNLSMMALLELRALPLLERLKQLLEEKQLNLLSPNICAQHISGLTKPAYGLEIPSRVWTALLPEVKGISTNSLRDPVNVTQPQETEEQVGSEPTCSSQPQNASSEIQSEESQQIKEAAGSTHIAIPAFKEEQWKRLLEVSPVFQFLKETDHQLRLWAGKTGLLGQVLSDNGRFIDVLDAHWACEGELIPLNLSALNPREFLVYQHGLFLIDTLHHLKLTPAVSLQIAATLPNNNYYNNAFRNSFFYQQAEEMLFVRRQRLQCVGGFSLLLLHCLSHIKIKDMSSDFRPAFQRLFYKTLQEGLRELFQARLGVPLSSRESSASDGFQQRGDLRDALSNHQAVSVLHRLHRPSRGLLSNDEVEKMQMKHRETALLSRIERLIMEKSSEHTDELGEQI